MQKQNDVKTKLNTLASGAINAGYTASGIATMLEPLQTSVSSYYASVTAAEVTNCISALTHCLIRTEMVYEDGTSYPATGTAPTGYDDVTSLFTSEDAIVNCTQSSFNSSIVDDGTGVYTSSLVTAWTTALTTAAAANSDKLTAIADYAREQGLGNSLYFIYDSPNVKSVPSLTDIAKKIYTDKKYSSLISAYGLSVYIPEALNG